MIAIIDLTHHEDDNMLRRHKDLLENRLEEVKCKGWTHIAWNEIYLWFEAERIAVKTYKKILDTYRNLIEDDEAELLLTAVPGGFLLTSANACSTLDDIIEYGYDHAPSIKTLMAADQE